MFSGIVEELGRVRSRTETQLEIEASLVLDDCKIGDSIAVNGACLTVISFDGSSFVVDVVPETWRRTNLGETQPGSPVNLERSVAANGRIGGHFVQGHVDGTGTVSAIRPEANGVVTEFIAPPNVARYLVPKGFIAIDGVSLTIVDVIGDKFTIALIPHTREVTTLGARGLGDAVNLEADILGKYVERFVGRNAEPNAWMANISVGAD